MHCICLHWCSVVTCFSHLSCRQAVRYEVHLVARAHLTHAGLTVPWAVEGASGTKEHYSPHPSPTWPDQHQALLHLGGQQPRLGARLEWFLLLRYMLYGVIWMYVCMYTIEQTDWIKWTRALWKNIICVINYIYIFQGIYFPNKFKCSSCCPHTKKTGLYGTKHVWVCTKHLSKIAWLIYHLQCMHACMYV